MKHFDPASLLTTEARVIAENDTHAVIAIRIPKRWIMRNIGFLAAMVDLVLTGRRPRP